jgi:hypothetical protein
LPQKIILTHNTAGVTRYPAPTHSRRLRIAGAYPGADLHGLERVWTPAELGTLIVEATNRKPLLDLGRTPPRTKGPALDRRLLPDDRLAHLIQTHRDLAIVAALAPHASAGAL